MQRDYKYKKPEIMAPARDWVGLRSAMDAGADAVYFGIKGFNMRDGARNFSSQALKRIARLCHGRGVKAYLALNSIIYEKELTRIRTILSNAAEADIDAVIGWDLSVLQIAHQYGLPIFASTQMSISNSSEISFFYQCLGIKRFVLARECSLTDIKRIKQGLKSVLGAGADEIEIEVFVHGAMCVSISGRCLMSQFQFGKSANRGECIQPCRREYLVTDKEEGFSFTVGNDYVLSPKDLCTLPFIEKLIEAGISAFKIEGRNKAPEYVSVVTDVYRKAVDFYFENRFKRGFKAAFKALKAEQLKRLEMVYNRGFSSGFFLGRPVNEWTDSEGSKATTRKDYVGLVTNYYKRPGVAEIKVYSHSFRLGDEIMFQGVTTGVFSTIAESIEVCHEKVAVAHKGGIVAVKVDKQVRGRDKVYVIKPVQGSKFTVQG